MLVLLLSACGLDTVEPPPEQGEQTEVTYGDLTLSAETIDFGYVAVGDTTSVGLVLTNDGAAAIELLGASLGNDVYSTDISTGTVEPGGDLVVTVRFEPTSAVAYTDALALETDSAEASLVYVDLLGTAEVVDTGDPSGGSYLDVSWRSHDFGEVDINKGATETVLLTNTGDEALLISDFVGSDESIVGWEKDFTLPYVLDVGMSKEATVSFTPTAETSYSETLTITSDADNETALDLSIQGEGFHGCDICAALIAVDTGGDDAYSISDFFVLISPWGNTDERTVEIWNEGDEDLVIDSISVSNESLQTSCSFSVNSPSGKTTVTPWSYETITVTYTATDSCVFDTGTVDIKSNDPYEPTYTLDLTGGALAL
ncbi:MAG: choice-of-anchor D domain-containing protein [Proteobacteria bacterium]|nr:choice-of-anchor D domain-containing protein [Pseudomonadota bacterium]MCP4916878.1 choice-of-anchor D domain-containing protein [Pseudomonadota bacterium]